MFTYFSDLSHVGQCTCLNVFISNTAKFFSDPIPCSIQAGVTETDMILLIYTKLSVFRVGKHKVAYATTINEPFVIAKQCRDLRSCGIHFMTYFIAIYR